MSIYVAWTSVGGVCGRLTAGILGYHFGWRTAMVALALLTGAAAAVLRRRNSRTGRLLLIRGISPRQTYSICCAASVGATPCWWLLYPFLRGGSL